VHTALHALADQLDRGTSLEDALANLGPLLPRHMSGLILAAARTGAMGDALMDMIELQQSSRELRRVIADAFWYPLVVLVLALGLLLFFGAFVTRSFQVMFADFGLSLPLITELVLWWGGTGIWLVLVIAAVAVVLFVVYRGVAGRASWQRLLGTMPVLGPVWQASGVAQWMGLLRVLLTHGVTLPDALRLAGHGAHNAAIGQTSLRLADGVVRGRPLSQLLMSQPALPATLVPLVQWGEQAESLRDAFQLGQDMFEERARARAGMIQAILPPLLFIGVGCMVIFIVVGLFMPLINLISQLS
jgi:type II secretory pathway component PulF